MGILLFLVGIVMIIKCGNIFTESSSIIAQKLGMPKFVVGATVVSLATTCPDIMVSVVAGINGSKEMGIGNAIGSVSCNIGIAMTICILFSSIHINMIDFWAKGIIMIATAVVMFIFSSDMLIEIKESLFLLAMLIIFFWINIDSAKNERKTVKKKAKEKIDKIIIFNFCLGAAGIVVGARFLVCGGQQIAMLLNVPEKIIGVTLVAIGTSLPEIIAAIIFSIKGESSMSVGNIVGANIIDMTLTFPIYSMILKSNVALEESVIKSDIPVSLVLCIATVVPTIFMGEFKKWQAFMILGVYIGYMLTAII